MSYGSYELWPVGRLRRAQVSRRFVQLGDVFVAPTTPPPFSFSIPDGKGGWTTVGTLPAAPTEPPKPAGPAPELTNWVQVGAAAAGGVVALATLYFMLKERKGKKR